MTGERLKKFIIVGKGGYKVRIRVAVAQNKGNREGAQARVPAPLEGAEKRAAGFRHYKGNCRTAAVHPPIVLT